MPYSETVIVDLWCLIDKNLPCCLTLQPISHWDTHILREKYYQTFNQQNCLLTTQIKLVYTQNTFNLVISKHPTVEPAPLLKKLFDWILWVTETTVSPIFNIYQLYILFGETKFHWINKSWYHHIHQQIGSISSSYGPTKSLHHCLHWSRRSIINFNNLSSTTSYPNWQIRNYQLSFCYLFETLHHFHHMIHINNNQSGKQ